MFDPFAQGVAPLQKMLIEAVFLFRERLDLINQVAYRPLVLIGERIFFDNLPTRDHVYVARGIVRLNRNFHRKHMICVGMNAHICLLPFHESMKMHRVHGRGIRALDHQCMKGTRRIHMEVHTHIRRSP